MRGRRRRARPTAPARPRRSDRHVGFVAELREALSLAGAAGVIGSPVSHSELLEMIVRTAAHVIDARAASLCLVDETSQQLVFEVVQGEKAQELKKERVPLGHGIAGLVALTGQPMAVSDAQRDARHAADVARRVGYMPRALVAVPLFYRERVIGVLELLDKKDGASFGAADMHALGLFAHQAAVAIQQSRAHTSLTDLLLEVMRSLGGLAPERQRRLADGAAAFARDVEDGAYRHALELARLVREIARHGDGETLACRRILEGFADYLRSRPRPGGAAIG